MCVSVEVPHVIDPHAKNLLFDTACSRPLEQVARRLMLVHIASFTTMAASAMSDSDRFGLPLAIATGHWRAACLGLQGGAVRVVPVEALYDNATLAQMVQKKRAMREGRRDYGTAEQTYSGEPRMPSCQSRTLSESHRRRQPSNCILKSAARRRPPPLLTNGTLILVQACRSTQRAVAMKLLSAQQASCSSSACVAHCLQVRNPGTPSTVVTCRCCRADAGEISYEDVMLYLARRLTIFVKSLDGERYPVPRPRTKCDLLHCRRCQHQ